MKNLLALLLCSMIALPAFADDWNQFRGPERTGRSAETGLLKSWPEGGPKKVWMTNVAGLGYSGMAVVGDTIYTMGARGEGEEPTDYLIAINVKDGSEKWATEVGAFHKNGWGDGPRSTPTVEGDFVYALSGLGDLVCANANTGKIVWKKSAKDFGGRKPNWGFCESVLVDGDNVVFTPGGKQGTLVALNKKNGELVWQSSDFTEGAQYGSIINVNHGGKQQYMQLTQKALAGLDPKSGSVLWKSEWPGKTAVIPTLIYHNNSVFVTSGYGVGCKLVELKADGEAVDVYDNKNMKNHHGGVIRLGDHVYGYSDGVGWACIEMKTGEIVWNEKKGLNKGCLTYADGKFYLQAEGSGEIVLIDATPEGWKENGRFKLDPQTELRSPKGKIWTHPTVANGRLYVRDQELLFSFDIKE